MAKFRRKLGRGDEFIGESQEYDEETEMTASEDRATDAALWRRWRRDFRSGPGGEASDPLLLAAYAEGRLGAAEQDAVEDWLADHPEALDDVLAAAGAESGVFSAPPDSTVLRAAALVGTGGGKGTVVPFPLAVAQRRRAWRSAAAWGGLAASLLVTSLVGFGIGDDAYSSLTGQPTAIESAAHELIDPPSTIFDEDEEPDI